jgi:ribA/ribD-fused uncharacterized protein
MVDIYMTEFFKQQEKKNEPPVTFYSTRGAYGCFSNFSRHPIKIDGLDYPTTEHYYQSKKFEGTRYETEIRRAKGPKEAATLGRDPKKPLRDDWEEAKEAIMYTALKAKFSQHRKCRDTLLDTGEAKIIEASSRDAYWGWGANRLGKNRLGVLLMKLREELRN